MITTYYLDESGSSGDLVNTGEQFNFAQQPIFALACIGVDDTAALAIELHRLKKHYRVQSAELKSTSVRDKPDFIKDLLIFLRDRDWPIFVEVVEKRFQICATMVSNLIMPAVTPIDLDPPALWIRNQMAEHMHARMPSSVLAAYIDACESATLDAAETAYQALLFWSGGAPATDEIAQGIHLFASDTYEDFKSMDRTGPETWRSGLPIPDDSKRGKPFWMLPNLSCFTNVYARINRLHEGNIGGVTLFHDEQLQFDEILHSSKTALEGLAEKDSAPFTRFADYTFTEAAKLEFVTSTTDPGIQAADVIAGFVMRHVQDRLYPQRVVGTDEKSAFETLLTLSNPQRGVGTNFVMTAQQTEQLGVYLA